MGLLRTNETAGTLNSMTCAALRRWRGWTERIEESLALHSQQEGKTSTQDVSLHRYCRLHRLSC